MRSISHVIVCEVELTGYCETKTSKATGANLDYSHRVSQPEPINIYVTLLDTTADLPSKARREHVRHSSIEIGSDEDPTRSGGM